MDLHFILGGAVVGFIIGATGIGAGSMMTPLLMLGFGEPAPVAVGTALMCAAITKTVGTAAHGRRGSVSWPITGWLAVGSLPAAVVTLLLLHSIAPDTAAFAKLIRPVLGAALLLTAAALLFQAQIQALGRRFEIQALGRRFVSSDKRVIALAAATGADYLPVTVVRVARPLPTALVGVVIGALVTLTSVGAGVLGVVALFFLYPLLPARQLVGADIAHAMPLTLVAGLGHAALGTVNWPLLGALLVGSLPAITLGAAVAHRVPERALRTVLALMLVGVGFRLLVV